MVEAILAALGPVIAALAPVIGRWLLQRHSAEGQALRKREEAHELVDQGSKGIAGVNRAVDDGLARRRVRRKGKGDPVRSRHPLP